MPDHTQISPSLPLRMAVIGVGAMGRAHCRTIVEQVPAMRLTAVVDVHEGTAREAGKAFALPFFSSVDDFLSSDVADAVLVATPHPLHLPAVVACLSRGLHVLCEKPLAETVSAVDRMQEAARRAQRVLGVMFQYRFEPAFAAALDFVRSGNLGEIRRTLLVAPDFRTQCYYDANPWRATWKGEGGGVLINQAPHLMDQFALLGGLPQSLRGHTQTRLHVIDVEDQADALLHYSNGATGYFHASTNEPLLNEQLLIVGSRGSLRYRRQEIECYVFDQDLDRLASESEEVWGRPKARNVTATIEPVPTNRLQGLLMRNFARHILHGEPLRCDAETGARSLEIANAITLSSHLDAPVTLPVPRGEYDALLRRLRATASRAGKKRVRSTARVTDPGLL